jgi:hypothetical protein
MAADNLNYGIQKRGADQCNLLIHQNSGLVLRSLTSEQYSRIWDCDVVRHLQDFQQYGWKVPPAYAVRGDGEGTVRTRIATAEDCACSTTVRPGDTISPSGLYASDHDMFCFMVNPDKRIKDGTEQGLSRGFFLSNSEVGAGALKLVSFLYRYSCGNHIVWDAQVLSKIKIVHRGEAQARFDKGFLAEIRKYSDSSTDQDQQRILSAQRFSLGTDRETVLSSLFTRLRGEVSQSALNSSYDTAVLDSNTDRTIDPRTAWGMAQGMTRFSQSIPYQDQRNRIDRAAGKVLSMAF